MAERVDVKVGFSCNNRCRFCVQGDKRERHPDRDTAAARRLLEQAVADSDSVVFTGGEVTLRKDVVELVRHAAEVGFRRIQVQTNGRMLAYRKLCEELVAAGATEFSPALHGPTARIHDHLTRTAGAFEQTTQGIRNLLALGQRVLTNSVVVRSNYRHLPELAELLVELGVYQYQFAFVHPVGTASADFSAVVPRHALVEPCCSAGLQVGKRAGVQVMTEAIPYCFLRGHEDAAAERYVPRTKIFDAEQVLEDYTEYRLAEGKAHGEPCERCTWRRVCEGPWREYPAHYGWDEFVPRDDDPPADLR